MNSYEVNYLKSKIVNSGRYLEQVFETGFESYDQFQSFNQMCANHVDMCNVICERLKPRFMFLPTKRAKLYKDFRRACEWSVDIINALLESWLSSYNEKKDELKQLQLIEKRARLEHEIAIEYKEAIYEDDKKSDKKPYCGFKTSANSAKPKKRKSNKNKKDE